MARLDQPILQPPVTIRSVRPQDADALVDYLRVNPGRQTAHNRYTGLRQRLYYPSHRKTAVVVHASCTDNCHTRFKT